MISRETLTSEIILGLPHLHHASSPPIVSLSQAWSSWSGPNQIGTSRTVQGEVVWPSRAASSSLGGSDGRPRDLHCRPGKRPPHPQCHHDHLDTIIGLMIIVMTIVMTIFMVIIVRQRSPGWDHQRKTFRQTRCKVAWQPCGGKVNIMVMIAGMKVGKWKWKWQPCGGRVEIMVMIGWLLAWKGYYNDHWRFFMLTR